MLKRYLTVIFILSFTDLAFAAGTGDPISLLFSWDMLFKVTNFVIVLILLHIFAKKPITNMLRASAIATKEAAETGKLKVEEAERALVEMKEKISELEDEISQKKEAAIISISKEKEEIIKEAGVAAEKIRIQTQQRIDQEILQAKAKIREYLIEESMKSAESIVSDKVGTKEHEALLNDYSELLQKTS